jgi:hypothetical protein
MRKKYHYTEAADKVSDKWTGTVALLYTKMTKSALKLHYDTWYGALFSTKTPLTFDCIYQEKDNL